MEDQKNYDAEFCGNLAIHQTNSIQDYGYLLVLDHQTLNIVQGSENIEELTGSDIRQLINTSISSLFPDLDLESLQNEIAKGQRNRVPLRCTYQMEGEELILNVLLHVKKELAILEIEKDDKIPERSFSEVFQEVRSFISVLETTENLNEICQASIREIRRIAGFDGIRMYQFDHQWNGTVLAEEITGELESYLGQTFPASDVPKQARALYIKNPYRLIPNRSYKASRLFPVINPIIHGFLDLSDCNLRSIAAVHLEYMANMNVAASMSIRVMVEGQLWGLISCHHITEKYLGLEIRSIFEWLSMEISYRISSVIKQEELGRSAEMLKIQAAVVETIFNNESIEKGLTADENKYVFSLFNSTGFALKINGNISTGGSTPQDGELENLLLWASRKAADGIYNTQSLARAYDEAEPYMELASGILAIPFGTNNEDILIFFRPELIREINWGGNPNEAISFDKDGVNYHPRNSFKLWQQTVRGQSAKWTATEIEAAESFRNFLLGFRNEKTI
ncbi:GAF domain-containing protein [Pedobacter sp. BMA]|uniref:GAF domain-containing protein n=1 Tax=Pedobacter sp. BMA TaxID=1663685 RepID=UPI00064A541A|nr:GAF domain-containing protein [Pedobacter sp. BMA]KLT64341.1 phytochrome [Pedobacter sp. BMA]